MGRDDGRPRARATQTVAHRDQPRARGRAHARRRPGPGRSRRPRAASPTPRCSRARRTPSARAAARVPEEPDEYRTCFERDRDRILHSTAFRRLAGKTQVFIFPEDHMRTRLTHALEVAQVATAMARGVGLNVALTEAIALGHDCGHGPGGHASEAGPRALRRGRVRPRGLGRRRQPGAPQPLRRDPRRGRATTRGRARRPRPPRARSSAGPTGSPTSATTSRTPWPRGSSGPTTCRRGVRHLRRGQPRRASSAPSSPRWSTATRNAGVVGMDGGHAAALAQFRDFNYRAIYMRAGQPRPGGARRRDAARARRALRRAPRAHPRRRRARAERRSDGARRSRYVAGMTDRFACRSALTLLGWPDDRLPSGVDR